MSDGLTFEVTEDVARALLAEQHPDLGALELRPADRGWDNAVWRVGDELALRIPQRIAGAVLIEHERQWLPTLLDGVPSFAEGGLDASPHLRAGQPGCGYPWGWAVIPWHEGEVVAVAPPDDPMDAAERLGRFVAALHRQAPADAPENPWRGGPLTTRISVLRDNLDRLDAQGRSLGNGLARAEVAGAFADLVSQAGADPGPPLWLHGDLHAGNLIVRDGALRAVIDFGDITCGDRATDLAIAWSLFAGSPGARSRFREVAGSNQPIDDDTWARARGWAIALNVAYLQGEFTTPARVTAAEQGLAAALADH